MDGASTQLAEEPTESSRLATMVVAMEAELQRALIYANTSRFAVLNERDVCTDSYARYAAAAQKLTLATGAHWKLEVGHYRSSNAC